VHDFVCSVCGEAFSLTEPPDDEAREDERACPACGSALVRERWESRLRNAAPRPIEELRDCVG